MEEPKAYKTSFKHSRLFFLTMNESPLDLMNIFVTKWFFQSMIVQEVWQFHSNENVYAFYSKSFGVGKFKFIHFSFEFSHSKHWEKQK